MKRQAVLAVALLGLLAAPAASQDAETVYQAECDNGNADACSVLALMFETGEGLPRDLERAATLYGSACDLGDMEGCRILGDMYQAGQGVQRDLARTVSLYERSCNGGELLGCESLGLLYEAGRGVLEDPTEAAQLYRRACDGQLFSACSALGMLVQSGSGIPADPVAAANLFAEACDGGDARGCVDLGVSFQAGDGVDPDPELARQLYQRGCDAGDMLGCVNLGSLYRTGTGVEQDVRLAVSLYRRACDADEPMGCFNLGTSYEQGVGVPQDVVTAVSSFQRACAAGLQIGCQKLPNRTREQVEAPIDSSIVATYGTVADAETEDPIVDAIVDFPELGLRLVTDRNGRVDLPDLPLGRHLIRAEAVGYSVTEGHLRVPGEANFKVLLEHALVADADASGGIVGKVVSEDGAEGLPSVDISLVNRLTGRAISNQQGRFQLVGISPGLVELRFQALGYATTTSRVIVQPGKTIEVTARLSTRPIPIDPITVEAVRSPALERNGFYERKDLVHGTQFDQQDIERLTDDRLSDIFRWAPGVTVEGNRLPGVPSRVVAIRRYGATEAACGFQIYLDNVPQPIDTAIDEIAPAQVEAAEIYQGLDVPIEYRRQSSETCGIILIWTKRGV